MEENTQLPSFSPSIATNYANAGGSFFLTRGSVCSSEYILYPTKNCESGGKDKVLKD